MKPKPKVEKVVILPSEKPVGFIGTIKPPPKVNTVDRPIKRAKGQKVKPEELRHVRELMRRRYALDLELWELRNAGDYDYEVHTPKLEKADALLMRIQTIVFSMDHRDYFNNDSEWERFGELKKRVFQDGKRSWVKNPPWEDKEE